MSNIDRSARILFPDNGRNVRNVKFHTERVDVTAEELAAAIIRAESQIKSGRAKLIETVDGHLK